MCLEVAEDAKSRDLSGNATLGRDTQPTTMHSRIDKSWSAGRK